MRVFDIIVNGAKTFNTIGHMIREKKYVFRFQPNFKKYFKICRY